MPGTSLAWPFVFEAPLAMAVQCTLGRHARVAQHPAHVHMHDLFVMAQPLILVEASVPLQSKTQGK